MFTPSGAASSAVTLYWESFTNATLKVPFVNSSISNASGATAAGSAGNPALVHPLVKQASERGSPSLSPSPSPSPAASPHGGAANPAANATLTASEITRMDEHISRVWSGVPNELRRRVWERALAVERDRDKDRPSVALNYPLQSGMHAAANQHPQPPQTQTPSLMKQNSSPTIQSNSLSSVSTVIHHPAIAVGATMAAGMSIAGGVAAASISPFVSLASVSSMLNLVREDLRNDIDLELESIGPQLAANIANANANATSPAASPPSTTTTLASSFSSSSSSTSAAGSASASAASLVLSSTDLSNLRTILLSDIYCQQRDYLIQGFPLFVAKLYLACERKADLTFDIVQAINRRCGDYYKEGPIYPIFRNDILLLADLLSKDAPDLSAHFNSLSFDVVDLCDVLVIWCLPLFALYFPPELMLRTVDILLLDIPYQHSMGYAVCAFPPSLTLLSLVYGLLRVSAKSIFSEKSPDSLFEGITRLPLSLTKSAVNEIFQMALKNVRLRELDDLEHRSASGSGSHGESHANAVQSSPNAKAPAKSPASSALHTHHAQPQRGKAGAVTFADGHAASSSSGVGGGSHGSERSGSGGGSGRGSRSKEDGPGSSSSTLSMSALRRLRERKSWMKTVELAGTVVFRRDVGDSSLVAPRQYEGMKKGIRIEEEERDAEEERKRKERNRQFALLINQSQVGGTGKAKPDDSPSQSQMQMHALFHSSKGASGTDSGRSTPTPTPAATPSSYSANSNSLSSALVPIPDGSWMVSSRLFDDILSALQQHTVDSAASSSKYRKLIDRLVSEATPLHAGHVVPTAALAGNLSAGSGTGSKKGGEEKKLQSRGNATFGGGSGGSAAAGSGSISSSASGQSGAQSPSLPPLPMFEKQMQIPPALLTAAASSGSGSTAAGNILSTVDVFIQARQWLSSPILTSLSVLAAGGCAGASASASTNASSASIASSMSVLLSKWDNIVAGGFIKYSELHEYQSFPCVYMEGYLSKARKPSAIFKRSGSSGFFGNLHRRYFILQGHFLTYFKSHLYKKPSRDESVDLRVCQIVQLKNHEYGPYGLQISQIVSNAPSADLNAALTSALAAVNTNTLTTGKGTLKGPSSTGGGNTNANASSPSTTATILTLSQALSLQPHNSSQSNVQANVSAPPTPAGGANSLPFSASSSASGVASGVPGTPAGGVGIASGTLNGGLTLNVLMLLFAPNESVRDVWYELLTRASRP